MPDKSRWIQTYIYRFKFLIFCAAIFIYLLEKLDYSVRVFATLIYYSYVTLGSVIFYYNFFYPNKHLNF